MSCELLFFSYKILLNNLFLEFEIILWFLSCNVQEDILYKNKFSIDLCNYNFVN